MYPGAVSLGTRRLDHTQLPLLQEVQKLYEPKLVLYIMAITLASVASVINEPIYSSNAELTCLI